jgi:hypothetical protein
MGVSLDRSQVHVTDEKSSTLFLAGSGEYLAATVGWSNITGNIQDNQDLVDEFEKQEKSLGNPAEDNMFLSSLADGTRSWKNISSIFPHFTPGDYMTAKIAGNDVQVFGVGSNDNTLYIGNTIANNATPVTARGVWTFEGNNTKVNGVTLTSLGSGDAFLDNSGNYKTVSIPVELPSGRSVGRELSTDGTDDIWNSVRVTPNTITEDYVLYSGASGSIVSPTINDGVVVEIPDDSTIVIL